MSVTVGIVSDSRTLHLTICKLSLVPALIWPDHDSFTLHGIVYELSLIYLTRVGKVVLALSMELSIEEVTVVCAALKLEATLASLLAFNEVAIVLDLVVLPELNTFAVLQIVNPLAII